MSQLCDSLKGLFGAKIVTKLYSKSSQISSILGDCEFMDELNSKRMEILEVFRQKKLVIQHKTERH